MELPNMRRRLAALKLDPVSYSDLQTEYPRPSVARYGYQKAGIKLWPDSKVFYTIGENVDPCLFKNIKKAIENFTARTPVLWIHRTNQEYYVKFVQSDCSQSYIGCVNKAEQEIEIESDARYGTVIHEMCHALGMEHEHCRADRDDFVECYELVLVNGDVVRKRISEDNVNFGRLKIPTLGGYDYHSVMHYCEFTSSEEGIKLKVRDDRYRDIVGQREDFSNKDLEKIDVLYGGDICTFDKYGEKYRPVQWYFKCITCWGENSNYGCCIYCAYKCHKSLEHKMKRYRTEADSKFVCDCGRNRHVAPMCTLLSTGAKPVKQTWYHCYDCFDDSKQGCCYACSEACHKSHNIKVMGTGSSTCDCGIEASCKFNKQMEKLCTSSMCTYDRFKELYRSATYYECHTCWGGDSYYGCCTYCANNHHKGHNLHQTSSSRFVCDCGRYNHKTTMCTLLSTGNKRVKQDWYHCKQCFTNPKHGCCYACYIKCHKGHSTYKMGNASSTCDCGSTLNCELSNHSSIEKIVTNKMCSYEHFKDQHMPMNWYECYTCFGGESDYGCCSFCIRDHHEGHNIAKHEGEPLTTFCHCGKMNHKQPCCTWVSSKKEHVKQPWYFCLDCFQNFDEGCCHACAKNCHKGHNVHYIYISQAAYCDCGLSYCKTSCKIYKV